MKEFFKENGHYSMIRLLSFIVIITAVIVCAVILIISLYVRPVIFNSTYLPADVTVIRELIYLVGTLLVFSFGGKAVQKYAERENNISAGNDEEK